MTTDRPRPAASENGTEAIRTDQERDGEHRGVVRRSRRRTVLYLAEHYPAEVLAAAAELAAGNAAHAAARNARTETGTTEAGPGAGAETEESKR